MQLRAYANGSTGHGMGESGSGSGKGGGSGGSVRDAGGAFGKMEAAREEEFFHRKNLEQLKKLKALQRDVTGQILAIEKMGAAASGQVLDPDAALTEEDKELQKRYFGTE